VKKARFEHARADPLCEDSSLSGWFDTQLDVSMRSLLHDTEGNPVLICAPVLAGAAQASRAPCWCSVPAQEER
jgi:hypothetical protein